MSTDRYAALVPWGIMVLRVVVGFVFLMHGGQKLFSVGIGNMAAGFGKMGMPLPMLMATLATGAEFLGGLFLLLGLFTRLAAIPVAFTMLVAGLLVHRGAFFLPKGFEYVLVLFAANVTLMLTGGGMLAMDQLIFPSRGQQRGFDVIVDRNKP